MAEEAADPRNEAYFNNLDEHNHDVEPAPFQQDDVLANDLINDIPPEAVAQGLEDRSTTIADSNLVEVSSDSDSASENEASDEASKYDSDDIEEEGLALGEDEDDWMDRYGGADLMMPVCVDDEVLLSVGRMRAYAIFT